MHLSNTQVLPKTLDLSNFSNQELLSRMDKLVHSERRITHLILCHINEVENRRLYADLGFDSMFKYLTSHCGYGEDSAYRRLQAARVLKQNPIVAEKLQEGSLNLTQLTQLQKCLKQDAKSGRAIGAPETLQILEQIQNKSSYETKKVLAIEFNQPVLVQEIVKPQQDLSVRLELTLTEEQMDILNEAKNILSHALPDGKFADVIEFLAKAHIRKVKGKTSSIAVKTSSQSEVSATPSAVLTPSFMTARKRPFIKVTDRRKILTNARYCCEYVSPKNHKRCQSKYQLQIDHKVPFALGGSSSFDNLRVLCRTHNLLLAKQWGLGEVDS